MARNQQFGSWNQNQRPFNSDDRIMRRDDDRTRQSHEWGSSQTNDRNSYRTDDYPTDKEMSRGRDFYDRDLSYGPYGSRNNQTHGQQNFQPSSSYNWSNDYRSSSDYRSSDSRPSYDRDSFYGSMRGDRFAGSSSMNHSGKGPKGYRRADERIKEDVSDALERNPEIDASEIELDVKDGIVSLRGHVEDRRSKRLAEDVIENMYGVKDVRNELQVDQSIFTQARNALLGEPVEGHSASKSKSKH